MTPHEEDAGSAEDMAAASLHVAEERLADAKDLYDIGASKNRPGSFGSAVNRAYYAAFSAITALHTMDGRFFRRHGQAIGAFNQFYVRTGIFDASYNRAVEQLKELRHASDYDFSYRISKEKARKSLDVAMHLVEGIKAYCFQKYPRVKAAYQSNRIDNDTPNKETLEAFREADAMKADPSTGKTYTDVDEMMKKLLADDEKENS